MSKDQIIFYRVSEAMPPDSATKSYRFVLKSCDSGLVTHMETFDEEGRSDGFHHGHYFKDFEMKAALADLQTRANKDGLKLV